MPLLWWIEKSQLKWYGHVLRMEEERMACNMLLGGGQKGVQGEKPRKRWNYQMRELGARVSGQRIIVEPELH